MIQLIGHKLRDSFTWNRNEQCLSPAEFARILCDDLELPPNHFVAPITESIESQLTFRTLKPCFFLHKTLFKNFHFSKYQ